MPDGLYERDILSWSKHQADLLRRLARGERVNDIDWQHVVEEIEDVGISELNAVRSYLRLMLVHLLNLQGWPDSSAIHHWRREIAAFQSDASQRFSPSMHQRVDVAALYLRAIGELKETEYEGVSPHPWPLVCPVEIDDLLNEDREVLAARFIKAAPPHQADP